MKWTLATAMFGITTMASPIVPAPDAFPLRLRLQSIFEELNGQYLGINGTTVGIFKSKNGAAIKPLEVYTVTDKKTGLVELHTYPQGKDDRLLALIGSGDGLLNLNGLSDPAAIQLPSGTKCDWRSFRMGGGNPPSPGRPGNAVTYAGGKGSWQAFPWGPDSAAWTVSFVNDKAFIPAINMPVEVVYVPAYDAGPDGEGLISIQ